MHWIAKPGTSVGRGAAHRHATPARSCARFRGCSNFGSHIGQAVLADEVGGVNFGEIWVSVDPAADYDATVAAIQEVVDGYPGLFHNVLTYLNERIDEVLTGAGRRDRRARSTGRTCDGLRDKARGGQKRPDERRRHRRPARRAQEQIPQVEVEVKLDRGRSATGSSRATCAGRGHAALGRKVGDIFRERQDLRRRRSGARPRRAAA